MLAGAGVGVAVAVIVAVLTFSRSPDIETSCLLNGNGEGRCEFTNRGSTGSACGFVLVVCYGGDKAYSNTFCSGDIGTDETKTVEYDIPGVRRFFDRHGKDWADECPFDWIPEED